MATVHPASESNSLALFKIKANRAGQVQELIDFLMALESAYNGLFNWNLTVDAIYNSRRNRQRYERDYPPFITLEPQLLQHISAEPYLRLEINRISIQSPGFWETLGAIMPLNQIREWLKDRHERRKDREWREDLERRKLTHEVELQNLTIINQQIDTLGRMGFSQDEIRNLLHNQVMRPLEQLGKHVESGLISYNEEDDEVNPI